MNESFEFLCEKCDQRFRVGRDKVGARLKCPRCQHQFAVPTPEIGAFQLADRAARRRNEPAIVFDEYVVHDEGGQSGNEGEQRDTESRRRQADALRLDEPPLPTNATESAGTSIQQEQDRSAAGCAANDAPTRRDDGKPTAQDAIQIPRFVLYVQAGLLVAVALLSFFFGALFGGCAGGRRDDGSQASGSRVLQGTVDYMEPNGVRADIGSVVLALPVDVQPQEPLPADVFQRQLFRDGLTPENTQALQVMRGELGAVGRDGRFAMELPDAGDYWILILSSSQKRPRHLEPRQEDLAAIGNYFRPAYDLLGDRQYRWQRITIPREQPLKIQF